MQTKRECERLLRGQAEIDAPRFVGFGGRGDVQLGDGNLAGALLGEDPQRLADDRVILDLLAVLIAKDQDSSSGSLRLRRRLWRRGCRGSGTRAPA